jgi:hypothetical protein
MATISLFSIMVCFGNEDWNEQTLNSSRANILHFIESIIQHTLGILTIERKHFLLKTCIVNFNRFKA